MDLARRPSRRPRMCARGCQAHRRDTTARTTATGRRARREYVRWRQGAVIMIAKAVRGSLAFTATAGGEHNIRGIIDAQKGDSALFIP